METQLAEAEATLSNFKPGESDLDPQLRNDLAQLHGNANKLLATRIDAILTGALPLPFLLLSAWHCRCVLMVFARTTSLSAAVSTQESLYLVATMREQSERR